MSKKEVIEEKAWDLLTRAAAELNLIPVDAEYVKTGGEYNLLLYADKEGGIGIDECEALSRAVDPLLDEADFIPDAYTLIVSSPGLGRQLKRPRDFAFAMGKEVEVRLYRARNGEKEFKGILKDADSSKIIIESDGAECEFDKADTALIRLAFDF